MERVMSNWALSVAAGVAVWASGTSSSAQGLMSGKYILNSGQSDDVIHAVESAHPGPSDINWRDVRNRLSKSILAYYELRISNIAGRFSAQYDNPKPLIDVWINGDPIKWQLNDGQVFDVSAKAKDESVLLTLRGAYSEQTLVYRSVGPQLVVETTIISPKSVFAPIHYKLVYNPAK